MLKGQPSNSTPPTEAEACEQGGKPSFSLLLHPTRVNQWSPKVLDFELDKVIQYGYVTHAENNCY